MRYALLLLLLPLTAHAADIRVMWDAVTQYTDGSSTNGVPDVLTLPAGTVSYEVWKSFNGGTSLKALDVTGTSYLLRDQPAGHYCVKVLARFTPATATMDTWAPSGFTAEACTDVVDSGGVGPRNLAPVPPKNLKVFISGTTPP